MEVPGLAVVAVFFIRPIWASLLVVAALRGWVAYSCNAFTGKLAVRAARTGLLIAAGGAVPVAVAALAFRVTALVTAAGMLTRKTVTFDLGGWRREKKWRHSLTPIIFFHHYFLDTRHFHHIYRPSRLLYLVGGVEAMSRAVWLRLVQHTHLPPAGLQQHHVSVVVMGQHLQQMLGLLQEAVVDVKRIPRPQLQVHLQHNGFGVLRVQQPGAPELRGSTVVRSEEIRWSKGTVEVAQTLATGGVGATGLIGAVGAIPGSVAAQGRGKTAGWQGFGARQRPNGTAARTSLGGGRGTRAFVGSVATFILTVALPRARKTLAIATQELILLTAALTQVTCSRRDTVAVIGIKTFNGKRTLGKKRFHYLWIRLIDFCFPPRMYERRKPWACPELLAWEWKYSHIRPLVEITGGGSIEPQSLKSPFFTGVSMSQSPKQLSDSTRSKLRKLEKNNKINDTEEKLPFQ